MEIKKILVLITIIANIGLVKAQYTAIPDYCFELILIQAGIDTEGIQDGQVLTSDIVNVTNLSVYLDNCPASNMTGIEGFINLEYLYFEGPFSTLDLSNNIHLKEIESLRSALQNINLTNCTELTSLRISNSFLTNIDLSNNINLETLILPNNQLSNINLDNNINLIEIHLRKNFLTSIDINSLTNLTKIGIDYNQITSLDINNLYYLELIYANYNLINNTNLTNLPNLIGIGLRNNNLTQIDISNLNNLNIINLKNNQLIELNLSENLVLNSLFCSENQITHLNLNSLPLLEKIDCSSNNLTELRIQNGNNSLLNGTYSSLLNGNPIEISRFITTNNTNLTCIYVNDTLNSQGNWTAIDAVTTFVETEAECEALAIEDINLETDFLIYPNPVKNILKIKTNSNEQIQKIVIYDFLGKIISQTNNRSTIDISNTKKGLYFVKIITKKGNIFNKKIIKIGA